METEMTANCFSGNFAAFKTVIARIIARNQYLKQLTTGMTHGTAMYHSRGIEKYFVKYFKSCFMTQIGSKIF
jgi:hypothetical protein